MFTAYIIIFSLGPSVLIRVGIYLIGLVFFFFLDVIFFSELFYPHRTKTNPNPNPLTQTQQLTYKVLFTMFYMTQLRYTALR